MKTTALFGAAALRCVPVLAKAQNADQRLRAIYTEEWKWRLEQFPGLRSGKTGSRPPAKSRSSDTGDAATLLAGRAASLVMFRVRSVA